ncbi:MAG TPA: N-acetyltransferase [Lachnospiraceae bacterium]|nr:N-acetyltransferase [Lachnospiraceae bacterium]
MDLMIRKLEERHLPMVDAFSCTETPKMLDSYNAKVRRRIRKHSKEMENFLKEEAFEEQEKGLNTTHLFIDREIGKIAAYISLCNDSIGLELKERDDMGLTYTTVPALKIARLAVANEYQGNGMGKSLIQFAAYMGRKIKELSGLVFLTLDCYEHRVSFYESVGFVRNVVQPVVLPYDTPISMRIGLEEYLERLSE